MQDLTPPLPCASEFIKESAGINDKTQKELEESLTRELRITWIKSLLLVLVGFLVGVFMLKKNKSGRTIALFLAGGLLLLRIIYFLKHWDTQTSPRFWTLFFEYYPVQTIQNIASIILLVVTIFLLLQPSIRAKFRWVKTET